jgi:hypothetical protein
VDIGVPEPRDLRIETALLEGAEEHDVGAATYLH